MVSPEFGIEDTAPESPVSSTQLLSLIATEVVTEAEAQDHDEEPLFDRGEEWPSFDETPLFVIPRWIDAFLTVGAIVSYLNRAFNFRAASGVNKAAFLIFESNDGPQLRHITLCGSQNIMYHILAPSDPTWKEVLKKEQQLPDQQATSGSEAGLEYQT